jgi:leucyl aminopeptidase
MVLTARGAGGADRWIVAGWQGKSPDVGGLPAAVRAAVAAHWDGKHFRGGREQQRSVRLAGGRELVLHGLGERAAISPRAVDTWCHHAVAAARRDRIQRLAVRLPDDLLEGAGARRALRRLALAAYRFDRFRRPRRETGGTLRQIAVLAPGARRRELAIEEAILAGAVVTRDLANSPPNLADPAWMAARARELGRRHGFRTQVLDLRALRRRRMGGLLAVGCGSASPPRLVRLAGGSRGPVIALVGKGVTFDTGGISIKPAAQLDEMKYDKSGACTVLGILEATARLQLPVRLRAYLPLAENMPDGRSYRPGDIVRTYSGTTVEITNTDAEGRMILADAVAWAVEEKPDALLEFSTLTGACVVALGNWTAGLFSPDDVLAAELLGAAARAGESLWRLPMGPDYLDDMKGTHGDLRNSGPRWGGASNAASFLGEFAKPLTRWAHIDIAGPAYVGHDAPEPRGATGYGVATVVEWLREVAGVS